MTEKRHDLCRDTIGGEGEIGHRCERDKGHTGSHRCSCGEEWTFVEPDAEPTRSKKPGK